MKLKRILYCTCFLLLCSLSISAQSTAEQEYNRERVRLDKKAKEDLHKQIQEFISYLNKADDFQKEIMKQELLTYFENKKEIILGPTPHSEKEQLLIALDFNHFKAVEEMVSSEIMTHLKGFITDRNAELKLLKKTTTKHKN